MQNIRASLLPGYSKRVPRRPARAPKHRKKDIAMSDPTERRDAARRTAQSHFTHTERRDEMVRAEIAKERAAVDAKTAKLRALRLAKEATEKAEADRLAQERAKLGAVEQKKPRRKPTRAA
jgi:hypothetical protein